VEIALEELEQLDEGELRRFGLAGNPSFLLETPYIGWPFGFSVVVVWLIAGGVTP
jgi:hypothetical protein